MKIRMEVDKDIFEDEIIIKCREFNSDIYMIQEILAEALSTKVKLIFYKDNSEYYIPIDDILFFETEGNSINGHTNNETYEVKYKLYELEELLPREFIRVSKSTILNVKHISAIDRNITSSSLVVFENTYKKTYVSRLYYKNLKDRIMEVRGYNER